MGTYKSSDEENKRQPAVVIEYILCLWASIAIDENTQNFKNQDRH